MDYGKLAIVFDFDDTLVPDSTTKFLVAHGVDTSDFWGNHGKALIESGYDPALAYLKLFLDNVGGDKPPWARGQSEVARIREGTRRHLYQSLPSLFDDLQTIVKKHKAIDIEFLPRLGRLAGHRRRQQHCPKVLLSSVWLPTSRRRRGWPG